MPTAFSKIFETLLKETEQLAKNTVTDYAKEAAKDGSAFLNKLKIVLKNGPSSLAMAKSH